MSRMAGVDGRAEFRWTATPMALGNHALHLDLEALVDAAGSANETVRQISVNDEVSEELLDFGIRVLPIKVYTIWGISERTYSALQAVLGLLSFVLLYPAVSDWVGKRLPFFRPIRRRRSRN